MASYTTLPELLHDRLKASRSHIGFLNADGGSSTTLSYQELFVKATRYAGRLLSAGLTAQSNPVLGLFEDHENHIILFWSCCLGILGVLFIPVVLTHFLSRDTVLSFAGASPGP
jgi:acyl-CoA synthetase (AMP-forming)/AMP-acid ligase II